MGHAAMACGQKIHRNDHVVSSFKAAMNFTRAEEYYYYKVLYDKNLSISVNHSR